MSAKCGSTAQHTYLSLQEATFEEHQGLPLELPDHLAETHAEILLLLGLGGRHVRPLARLFGRETLLEAAQDVRVGEVPLREPRRGHDAQALPQHAEAPGAVRDHHQGLLYRRAGHVWGAVEQRRRVDLPCARDAEEGRRRQAAAGRAQEGEVGKILGGAWKARSVRTRGDRRGASRMHPVAQGHERQQRPVILH